jgi:uncharacterized repeat protein (TIGR03803 family)
VGTILHTFNGTDGIYPVSDVIEGTNGKFYGTTPYNNSDGPGTAYSVTSNGTFTTLHTFASSEGSNIDAGLVQGTDGNFYGVAQTGGAYSCYGVPGCGTIFKMTPSGTVTVLHNFDGSDGSRPSQPLVQASDGNFYGASFNGGAYDAGVVFKITPSGTYTVLHSLDPGASDGAYPSAALIEGTDGNLYGVTSFGVSGTIFSVTTTGTFTTLYTFCASGTCTDGANPHSPLIQNTNGIFYGSTVGGGGGDCDGSNCGTIFSLNMGLRPFVRLVTASGEEGAKIGILGQGFSSSSLVKFGGTKATTIVLTGTTFITATVPAGALTGSVTVTTGSTTLTSSRTFDVLPTLTKFAPESGPVGTSVTITGTGLKQTTKVTFDGKSATFKVISDTEVTADVPTGAKTGKIAVTTKGGSVTSSAEFTVN